MIELREVKKAFNQGQHNEYWALSGISLAIEPKQVTALRGPSGSGKTTLLTLIGCLARPTSGRVTLHGRDISGLPERFLTEIRRKTFGFVFQQFNLIKGLSAIENVMLPAYPTGRPHHELKYGAEALLAQLQLGHRRDARVEWLSGGEQQRVAIARAIAPQPKILLADEPTGNLDSRTGEAILDLLRSLSVSRGVTVVMVTHNVLAAAYGDRTLELRDGRLVRDVRAAPPPALCLVEGEH
jgi:putative ABC transport system ATP-binding protein